MNIKELKKNAEGYTDPTAAAVLSYPEPGDVYNYNAGECLILANHTDFFTTLKLKDGDLSGNVRINWPGDETRIVTVDPNYIITVLRKNLYDYVDSISTGDFKLVMEFVREGLGLKEEYALIDNQYRKLNNYAKDLKEKCEAMQTELDETQVELATLRQLRDRCTYEVDILRDLYDDLLTRFIKREG